MRHTFLLTNNYQREVNSSFITFRDSQFKKKIAREGYIQKIANQQLSERGKFIIHHFQRGGNSAIAKPDFQRGVNSENSKPTISERGKFSNSKPRIFREG